MQLTPANTAIIKRLLARPNNRSLQVLLEKLNLADLVRFFETSNAVEARHLAEALISMEKADRVLAKLNETLLTFVLSRLTDESLGQLCNQATTSDAAYFLGFLESEKRERVMKTLPNSLRQKINQIMKYPAESAGRIMDTDVVLIPETLNAQEAIDWLRQHAGDSSIYYAYCGDENQRLTGVLSLRQLATVPATTPIKNIFRGRLLATLPETPAAEVAKMVEDNGLIAIPIVDSGGQFLGLVAVDDVIEILQDTAEKRATESIQKIGGMEALDAAYFDVSLRHMIRKRAGWLIVLFLGEMFTATAMSSYEAEIDKAVVLALFIPLIISSGGNSGSQASTLIIRALALQEIRLIDWWRVFFRELCSGAIIGAILGAIGLLRIVIWQAVHPTYGEHYMLVAMAVASSLIGVVTWGTLAGSMLPFVLRKVGFDPASASAPFVATLVDVTGLIIYFSTASFILHGTLL